MISDALKGFTCESSELVTLAHLSIILGNTGHIKLEYEWRKSSAGGTGAGESGERLSNMLRRLSGMAMTEYRDITQRAVSCLFFLRFVI